MQDAPDLRRSDSIWWVREDQIEGFTTLLRGVASTASTSPPMTSALSAKTGPPQVLGDHVPRLPVPLDEDGPVEPAAQGLYPERAGPRVEVEDAPTFEELSQRVEEALPHAVGGRPHALRDGRQAVPRADPAMILMVASLPGVGRCATRE